MVSTDLDGPLFDTFFYYLSSYISGSFK
jgi:hypothetical protein